MKLISGGQTGADSSIIAVGERLGIPIGGNVPRGCRTEQGPNPRLKALGFTESESHAYAARTRENIEHSDATLILATDPSSDGTELTIDHAQEVNKPCLVLDPFDPVAVEAATHWLHATRPAVLNVAGNRESKSPGIARQAERVLHAALRAYLAS
ncbi:MAG: putative molybdenum carrier protein [Sedimenticolaceae bacterium]